MESSSNMASMESVEQNCPIPASTLDASQGLWTCLKSLIWYILPMVFPILLYRHLGGSSKRTFGRELKGQVVLITGASSGLGEALAHVFYKAGCKLILASRRVEELDRVKESLLATNQPFTIYPPEVLQLDLTNIESVPAQAMKALSFHGHVDILINNAGISHRGSALHTRTEVDIQIMTVNYFGQIALTKILLQGMVSRGRGHIVAISSIQGLIGIPYRSAYAASKHALQAFCDSLRAEVAQHGVKVTVISPGYIRTQLSKNALNAAGHKYGQTDPSTEEGYPPEEVAAQILAAVVSGKNELIISSISPRVAIFLRHFLPSVFFRIMNHRAKKLNPNSSS